MRVRLKTKSAKYGLDSIDSTLSMGNCRIWIHILYKEYYVSGPFLIAVNGSTAGPFVSHLNYELMRPCEEKFKYGDNSWKKIIKIHSSAIYIGLFDWKQPPGQKAAIFQFNCCILVAFGLNIRDFFSFCPYFDSDFGLLFAWLPYINELHKPWVFDEYSQSTTISKIRCMIDHALTSTSMRSS